MGSGHTRGHTHARGSTEGRRQELRPVPLRGKQPAWSGGLVKGREVPREVPGSVESKAGKWTLSAGGTQLGSERGWGAQPPKDSVCGS